MSLTITLPNELEQFLQNHAQRAGIPVETLLARTIVERWESVRRAPGLPNRESELLLRLQTLFPPSRRTNIARFVPKAMPERSPRWSGNGCLRSSNSATIRTLNASKSSPNSRICAAFPCAK